MKKASPCRGDFWGAQNGFPYEGKLSAQLTDEVDCVANFRLPSPHPSRLPPSHLPLIGEGIGALFGKMIEDIVADGGEVTVNVQIGIAQDPQAEGRQIIVTGCIGFFSCLLIMLGAVDLN